MFTLLEAKAHQAAMRPTTRIICGTDPAYNISMASLICQHLLRLTMECLQLGPIEAFEKLATRHPHGIEVPLISKYPSSSLANFSITY